MAAGRGQLERATGPLLSSHVSQVRSLRARSLAVRRDVRRRPASAVQIRHRLGQMAERDRLYTRKRSLGRGLSGTEDALEAASPRSLSDREYAADRTKPPIECELTDDGVPPKRRRFHLPRGGEDRQRDGEIERRSLLAQFGRREIDDDAAFRELELSRGDSTAYALFRLLAGSIRQPDDGQRGLPVGQVGLDLDAARLEADECMSCRASEHSSTVGRKVVRVCAEIGLEDALEPLDLAGVHADDVEGRLQSGVARVGGQPERGSPPDPLLLFLVHHLHGVAEVEAGAHLDLAEDQPGATPNDQVDLTTTEAGVRRENPVATHAEVQTCATFGCPAGG